jgi:polyferredoxin/Flp pilus assembly protein TadD
MKTGCETKTQKKQRSIPLPVLQKTDSAIKPSRTGFWRAIALITLNLLMIFHYVQWRYYGVTISPIEPSEAMFTLQNGAINAGFIFFTLAILGTLIFGRFVCGWGCHVLALQDFCGWLLKKIGLKPKPFRSRLLVFVPLIVAIYMFVFPTAYRFFAKPKNEPLIPEFTNHLITTEYWATFPTLFVAIPFLFICGFLTVYFLGQKGFCTYACPYGGFFNLADKVSPGKIRVTDACNQCGHCTATCTSNVLVHSEVQQYGMVVDSGCMKCMDCISVCPNDALYFGFGKPSIAVKKTIAKNYSLNWIEEVIGAIAFAASFFAVWDVYQLVPMLMALGIASVTAFLVLRFYKLLTANDLSFYRFNFKAAGKLRKSGFVFAAASIMWFGLIAHSGFIHYHEARGITAFQNLQIPDELALAQKNPNQWLSQNDEINISEGKKSLQTTAKFGLFANETTSPKLAWFEYLSGNTEQSVDLLGKAANSQIGQPKALSLYYRGAILNRSGQFEQALASLNQAIIERPDLVAARVEKGESLWRMNRKAEAVSVWNDAVQKSPNLALANNFLAGAASAMGKADLAITFEQKADKFTPTDAYFQWMLGLRLQNAGMTAQAEKHFAKAIEMNPEFAKRSKS